MPQTDSQQKTVGLILGHESSDDINDQLNWALIEWDDLEKRVYKIQKRISRISHKLIWKPNPEMKNDNF